MFIYNLTIKVDNRTLHQWIKWLREEHIPEIMATNLFIENKFFKLLEPDDSEASTFVLQCFTDSREKYNRYIHKYSNTLREKALQKWGDNFIGFEHSCKLCTNCAKNNNVDFLLKKIAYFPSNP